MKNRLVRLRPRPDTVTVSRGRTVLATATDGFIPAGSPYGLWVAETRLVSVYQYRIGGRSPMPVALSNVEQHSWLGYYILLPPGHVTGPLDEGSGQVEEASQHSLELKLFRNVGEGLHEDVQLTNFTQQSTSFALELQLDCDFASIEEIGRERGQHGEKTVSWKEPRNRNGSGERAVAELAFDYAAEHAFDENGESGIAYFHCGLNVQVLESDSRPDYRDGRIIFEVSLPPQGTWHACLQFVPIMQNRHLYMGHGCGSALTADHSYDHRRESFLANAARFAIPASDSLAPVVIGALEQAKYDLAALRLFDLDRGDQAWTLAAGLPVYVALFGRDALTTAWQAALISRDLLRGTLPELADRQGAEVNDWRDEQPGRMLHEAHTSPHAILNLNPRTRYYGATTTSAFYGVALSLLWHWTGDKSLIAPYIDPALRALRWLEDYGDSDHDGFYDYRTRSRLGNQNQGWKDSGDAIVYDDGSQVEPPTASCDEQGFVYAAKLHLSELLWWMDRKDEAKRLYHAAEELKKRFNDRYWMDDLGYFAMGLDSHGRQIKSIGSDSGHCIATGIVDKDLVERTADRMFESDLFTGWGFRTLSSANPAYNPYSYHRGSVWPVEHGTFAIGFARYGLHAHVERICRAQFEAAALFDLHRLPEVFSGHPRDANHPFPAIYPRANWPQAWSSSELFSLVQAMLGLYPYAPLHTLLVDPHLPEWLPEITISNLHVGEATLTIRFHRKERGASDYEVLDKRGHLHVLRQPSPFSLTAGYAERIKDALTSMLPGK